MEPIVMAILHRFDDRESVRAVSSDELHTLEDEDFPREWWVRTAFVPAAAIEPAKARERAWLTVEYSRWETHEEWTMQAFFRVAEVEFSLAASSDDAEPTLTLVASHLPAGDIRVVEEVLRAHFGGPSTGLKAG